MISYHFQQHFLCLNGSEAFAGQHGLMTGRRGKGDVRAFTICYPLSTDGWTRDTFHLHHVVWDLVDLADAVVSGGEGSV